MSTATERVALGVAWLDEHYPGWFEAIDLGSLEMNDCRRCILGQVYSGHIPTSERNQLIAQLVQWYSATESPGISPDVWHKSIRGWGGFSILSEFHKLPNHGADHGFLTLDEDDDGLPRDTSYDELLDAWTVQILERRMSQVSA